MLLQLPSKCWNPTCFRCGGARRWSGSIFEGSGDTEVPRRYDCFTRTNQHQNKIDLSRGFTPQRLLPRRVTQRGSVIYPGHDSLASGQEASSIPIVALYGRRQRQIIQILNCYDSSHKVHHQARDSMTALMDYIRVTTTRLNVEVDGLDSLRYVMNVLKEVLKCFFFMSVESYHITRGFLVCHHWSAILLVRHKRLERGA